MSIEREEINPIKESEEDKTAEAFRADLMEDVGSRHHHHHHPYPAPVFHRPTSRVNALQYEVRDGKITVKSR